tara:strand:- start:14546 stop:14794 length:249 start_codon:yes stop_codon:yes gene_type:complete
MIPPYSLEKLFQKKTKPDFTAYTQERKLDSGPSTADKMIGFILLVVLFMSLSVLGFYAQKKMLGVYDLEDRVRYLEIKLDEK